MDKKTALYWAEIIRKAEKGDKEAEKTFIREDKRRQKHQLPMIEEDIKEALHPTIQNPERETDGLPTRICEWP